MKREIQVVEEKHFQFNDECLDILIAVGDVHYLLSRHRCFICKKWFWCVPSIFDGDEQIYFCNRDYKWCICSECAGKHHQRTCYGVYIFLMSNPILKDIVTAVML